VQVWEAELTIRNSTLRNNTASRNRRGSSIRGGAIAVLTRSNVQLFDCDIYDNSIITNVSERV
jgi:hypothetical protein